MKFSVVTLFPEFVDAGMNVGVVGRGRQAGLFDVALINPRDFTHDKHRSVDDTPYGGGPGMVMKTEPLAAAMAKVAGAHRILLSPSGKPLTQARVAELASMPHVALVCGRYEGVDQRFIDTCIDEEISIGDFVLSGGELGALTIMDAVCRLVPGVLGEAASADDESFSHGLLEYPHYTRPPEFAGQGVPPVLASGNHAAIAAFRRRQAFVRTAARRPELARTWALSAPSDKAHRYARVWERTYIALVHYPVWDSTGQVVTSAVTNFDIHDIARSSATYGLAGYFVVTPVTSQREKTAFIAQMWLESTDGQHRASALRLLSPAASVAEVIATVTATHGAAPHVIATSARDESFPDVPRVAYNEIWRFADDERPLLLLLGTGWGLAEQHIAGITHVLPPIRSTTDWNHLSVRSAAAIMLDRLFGKTS